MKNFRHITDRPIVIHSPGKVGSSSVFHTLKNNINRIHSEVGNLYHTHNLNFVNLKNLKKELIARNLSTAGHIEDGFNVLKLMRNREIDFITLTRSPIERNLSAYFENHLFLSSFKYDEISVQDHIELFTEKYPHNVILKWFDLNIKKPIGIDVYESDFPVDIGYRIYEHQGSRLLVLKCELSDKTKKQVIEEYLQVEGLDWANENMGKNKDYSTIYEEFKSKIKLSKKYIDKMIQSKYCRHFYSEEEILLMKNRWEKS